MKCQKCGQHDATTHITKIINGKKSGYRISHRELLDNAVIKIKLKKEPR